MSPLTERFEMRLDEETLSAVDDWGNRQSDSPSRAEAIRRLIELGLNISGEDLRLSAGEKLTLWMLSDLVKALKVKSDIDPSLIKAAISGGHLWGLQWELGFALPHHVDSAKLRQEVVDILDMWDFIEGSYSKLSKADKEKLRKEVPTFGANPHFQGFDAHRESEYCAAASFLVKNLKRFQRFKDRPFDSHAISSLDATRRMVSVFLPMREKLTGGEMNVNQLIEVLKERLRPSRPTD